MNTSSDRKCFLSLFHLVIAGVSAEISMSYGGCFLDQATRTLPKSTTYYAKITNEMCASLCCSISPFFTYMGTEISKECFCGDQPNTSTFVSANETECNRQCGGDSSQICGGAWRISIYRIDCLPPVLIPECILTHRNQTHTPQEISEKIVKLKKEIAIDRKNTSSFKNKKRCAPDKRASSRNIGYFGIILLALPFALMLTNDFLRILNK